MKISEIIYEDTDLSQHPTKSFSMSKGDRIITVPDKIKDDPASQAAPIVQRGTELPKDHPWNLLHGDEDDAVTSKPPGKAPASKLTTV